jgi:hypothetical protein
MARFAGPCPAPLAAPGPTGATGAPPPVTVDFAVGTSFFQYTLSRTPTLVGFAPLGTAAAPRGVGTQFWNPAQNTFTAPVAGPYKFTINWLLSGVNAIVDFAAYIIINTVPLSFQNYTLSLGPSGSSTFVSLVTAVIGNLEAGDRVCFSASSPNNVTYFANTNQLQVKSLGF